MRINKTTVLHETPYLSLVQLDYTDHEDNEKKWYGVTRPNASGVVVIAALTRSRHLILVEQFRPMVGTKMIEMPAGLMDVEGESSADAAARELLEETGYVGDKPILLVGGRKGLTVSSGQSDERVFLYLIQNAEKVTEPLTNEGTVPFLLHLGEAYDTLEYMADMGREVEYKLFGTIRLLQARREYNYERHPID